MTILRIDSSANLDSSVTRDLVDQVLTYYGDAKVITRDLVREPLPFVTQDWSDARLVPAADRTDSQRAELALSDTLIAELRQVDTLVMGVPMYNFGIPASLKAWIDLIARPGETFRYTESGPKGLLEGKKAILVLASGGVPTGSDVDFVSGYLRHVLGFVGITEVSIVSADAMAKDPSGEIVRAQSEIAELPKAA